MTAIAASRRICAALAPNGAATEGDAASRGTTPRAERRRVGATHADDPNTHTNHPHAHTDVHDTHTSHPHAHTDVHDAHARDPT